MKINKDNYESYFLRHIEGRLEENETRELNAFLQQNSELKELLDFYDPSITIEKDDELVFDEKEKLIFAKPTKIVPMWTRYAAAAAVALLIVSVAMVWTKNNQQEYNTPIILAENTANNHNNIPTTINNSDDKTFVEQETITTKTKPNIASKKNIANETHLTHNIPSSSVMAENTVDFSESVLLAENTEMPQDETTIIEIYSPCLAEYVIPQEIVDEMTKQELLLEYEMNLLADDNSSKSKLADIKEKLVALLDSTEISNINFEEYGRFIQTAYNNNKEEISNFIDRKINKYKENYM